jgi:beta-lactamase regulating signal transducer with metallopeptidase domain
MSAITQALTAALLHFLWQGVAVAFLLWVALVALRNRSAQARYAAGLAALALLALAPVVTAVVEYRTPATFVAEVLPVTTAAVSLTVAAPASMQPASAAGLWVARLQAWALPLWSFGVLLFALRVVWGCGRISLMRRRATPAASDLIARVAEIGSRLGLAQPARVLMSAFEGSPSVVGWFRPVILLPPATLLGLTPEQLEAVLAHELAHIRRHDSLVNAAQILVETLLFYHPAVWWTSAQIRKERELCCDDLAVSACGDALSYARALTRLERLRVTEPALALGSVGGPLAYRIRRLMGAVRRDDSPSKLPGLLALALGVVCLIANAHWAKGQEQQQPAPERAQTALPQEPAKQSPWPEQLEHAGQAEADQEAQRELRQKLEEMRLSFARYGDADQQAALEAALAGAAANQEQQEQQVEKRAELEVLRQRVKELEEQIANRRGSDGNYGVLLKEQSAEDPQHQAELVLARQHMEGLLQNQKFLASTLQQKLKDLQTVYNDDFPDVVNTKRQLADAEEAIERLHRQMNPNGEPVAAVEERLAQMRNELAQVQQLLASRQLEAFRNLDETQLAPRIAELQQHVIVSKEALAGWKVVKIDVEGLSTEEREQLLARLPVKVGSALSEGFMDSITRTLKEAGGGLTFDITLGGSHEASIHITRPKF